VLTVTYADLKSRNFVEGLNRLTTIKALPHKVSYSVAKIYKALMAEEEIVTGLYDKILDQYAEKDPNGLIVSDPASGAVKLDPKTATEFNAKIREFWKQTVEIRREHLNLKHFISELTPRDIAALEPLWAEVNEGELKG
jgi:hypothetical protein